MFLLFSDMLIPDKDSLMLCIMLDLDLIKLRISVACLFFFGYVLLKRKVLRVDELS